MSKIGNIIFIVNLVLTMGLFFAALAQPLWRGADMVHDMRSECDQVGGVMIEHETMLGMSYYCSPRFDQGVKI